MARAQVKGNEARKVRTKGVVSCCEGKSSKREEASEMVRRLSSENFIMVQGIQLAAEQKFAGR